MFMSQKRLSTAPPSLGLRRLSSQRRQQLSFQTRSIYKYVYRPQGGGTLKFSVYIGEADFLGVKILNFRIFWGFSEKLVIF